MPEGKNRARQPTVCPQSSVSHLLTVLRWFPIDITTKSGFSKMTFQIFHALVLAILCSYCSSILKCLDNLFLFLHPPPAWITCFCPI